MNAPLAILHLLLLSNPAGSFLLAAWFASLDWRCGVGFALACVAALEMLGTGNEWMSFAGGRDTIRLLFGPNTDNQRLEEVDIGGLVSWLPAGLVSRLALERKGTLSIKRLRRNLRLVGSLDKVRVYLRTFARPPYDGVWKAYSSFSGTSMIFIRDNVDASSKAFDRFKLFHELAHVSLDGISLAGDRYRRILTGLLATAVVAPAATLTPYVAFVLFAFWIREILLWHLHGAEFEANADVYALSFLNSDEASLVLRLFERQITPTKGEPELGFSYRLYRMKRFVAARQRTVSATPHVMSWNSRGALGDLVFCALFAHIGFEFGAGMISMIVVLPASLFLVLTFLFHVFVFRKVAEKQALLERAISKHRAPNSP